MTRKSLRWKGFAAATALLTFAAGCGSDIAKTEEKLSEPAIDQRIDEPPDGVVAPRPLDAYRVTEDDSSVIFQAMQKVLRECMKAKGFEFKAEELPKNQQNKSAWIDPDSLGLLSAAAANETGYHRPSSQRKQQTPTGQGEGSAQSEDYRTALDGVLKPPENGAQPTDRGCRGEADKRLKPGGEVAADADLVSRLRDKSYQATAIDSRVKAAFTAWAGCMGKKGFTYGNPAEAAAAAWPDPASAAEIDTAKADMLCKKENKVLGTWEAVISAYQKELIKQNDSGLQGLEEAVKTRVDQAKAILGGR
ncbi:hypothetical protein [Amycolatopsis speibonae]|uniref:Lipoprotein n=1 Tax=Amycolatopsis speibonae TaxID=1450224 RepID=A0ABV7NZX9_9PSEU